MFVDFNCTCDSHLQMDSENEDALWSLVWRFVNQHAQCGFVTGGSPEERVAPTHLIRRPKGMK